MKNRRVVAAVASMLLTSATAIASAPPAAADNPVIAHAAIGVTYPTTTTFNVCPNGVADSVGEWLFELDGVRDDGSQIHVEQGAFSSTFSPTCSSISTDGRPDGAFIGTVLYARIPSPATNVGDANAIPEFVAVATVVVDWDPQQNAQEVNT